ncbi:(2Fe-2S)-binding protein [Nannocystis sp. SCPEA4]|uniref:(2Fe-2S)-binding protein n=1 Tax=Nannocystis sp. SCPEA4 TaxID=2996787 RepID=UPI002272134B|nr:(2Fe-2S)-binding protein [Nannocystis sp. SCPEA4]MCY1060473.1 (2Fe-2S)-binding protein [Nannocystis sp. SCPEA4]
MVQLSVNGARHELDLDPRTSLLDALREHLGLTGTKKGCDHGQCGACTVHIDGRRVLSCLALAVAQQGHEVTTIEGLAAGERLHPMQLAFIACDALQCGFCTPGQIMSAVAMLVEVDGRRRLTDAGIRERMSGNLCRCGAYPNILAAIRQVRP